MKNLINKSLNVMADKEMLRLILRNLVANAVKFSFVGSSVEVRAVEYENFCMVSVADTGVGINEQDINKLFRLDVHYTTKGTNSEQGTGLGLILCKELIEKHQGRIWVESEFGKGSTFMFTISKA